MSYDIFLVSAVEDRDTAKLVARRLRALKFKVWFDQKQVDETFDAKDARDAMNSQSMLVLWSAAAVKSDWVRAAASVAHSRAGALAEAALDKTIPYEPFRQHKRFSLDGMTSRKTPDGFVQLIEELGRRQGRTDLRDWMGFTAQQEDERLDWLAAHPEDPLALDAKKKREKDLGIKPAPAREAIGAAALAAASMRVSPPVPPPSAGPARPNGAAPLKSDGALTTATMAEEALGMGTMAAVGTAIFAMLILAWAFRSQPAAGPAGISSPAIANSRLAIEACPAGTVPRSMLRVLEPGPIIDDTQPQIIDDTSEQPG
ncbi:toll/interleukin-1 receptor domain-containing protein [Hyphomonas sp.]|uniref:toll/interleukin-1 receptor domain-containing protein n=1 Tax=Hyphomonas sp. TaxID=87 RepID=UPI00391ADC68